MSNPRDQRSVPEPSTRLIPALDLLGLACVRQSGNHRIYRNAERVRVTLPVHSNFILHPKILNVDPPRSRHRTRQVRLTWRGAHSSRPQAAPLSCFEPALHRGAVSSRRRGDRWMPAGRSPRRPRHEKPHRAPGHVAIRRHRPGHPALARVVSLWSVVGAVAAGGHAPEIDFAGKSPAGRSPMIQAPATPDMQTPRRPELPGGSGIPVLSGRQWTKNGALHRYYLRGSFPNGHSRSSAARGANRPSAREGRSFRLSGYPELPPHFLDRRPG